MLCVAVVVHAPRNVVFSHRQRAKVGARKADEDLPRRPDHLHLVVDLARRCAQARQPGGGIVVFAARQGRGGGGLGVRSLGATRGWRAFFFSRPGKSSAYTKEGILIAGNCYSVVVCGLSRVNGGCAKQGK